MDCNAISDLPLLLILFVTGFIGTKTQNSSSVLKCYDCADTFNARWNPYTACQVNVTSVPVATCVDTDRYCKVERVTVKGATISIIRSCAGECYYGCYVSGYGVSQLRCTTCCNATLCNTGSGTRSLHSTGFPNWNMFVWVCLALILTYTYRESPFSSVMS